MIQCFYILIKPRPNTKKPVSWDLKFHNFSYLSYQRGYSTLKNTCEFCIFPYELRPHTRTHNLGFYSYNRKLNAQYLEYLLNVKTLRKNTKLFNEYSLTQLMEPCPNTRTPEAMSFAIVVEGLPYSS